MTDLQYDILDELYFVIDFKKLQKNTGLEVNSLKTELSQLLKNNWVKLLDEDLITEIEYDSSEFEQNFDSYYYLATKSGLFKHNSE